MSNSNNTDKIDKLWDASVAKLEQATLNAEMKKSISQEDFAGILAYIKSPEIKEYLLKLLANKEAYNKYGVEISGKEETGDIEIAIPFTSSTTGLPRTFAITYNNTHQKFVIDIYLNQKTADVKNTDVNGKKIYNKIAAAKGGFNKYTRLLTVALQANKAPIVSKDYGRLVLKVQASVENNISTANKNKIQNALADMGICLSIKGLPIGSRLKISQKVAHAQPLDEYVATPQEMLQLYKEIIEKLAKLHAMGIVHGDLKPENILVYDGHAYIADLDTLGFVNQLHAPQGTTGYTLPLMAFSSLYSTNINLKNDVSPTELRKAVTYSTASDLYALANLLNNNNQNVHNNFAGNNHELGAVDKILINYLDPKNESYTYLSDNLAPHNQDLSLHDLYKKMFAEDLVVAPIDPKQKDRVWDALSAYIYENNANQSPYAYNWVSSKVKGEQGAKFVAYINDFYKELSSNDKVILAKLPVDVELILGILNSATLTHEKKLDQCLEYIFDLENGLFSGNVMDEHVNLVRNSNNSLAEIATYKNKLLLISEIFSMLVVQAELHNLEVTKGHKSMDVNHLLELEAIITTMLTQAIDAQNSRLHKKDSLTFSTEIPHAPESHEYHRSLYDLLAPTIALDRKFTKALNALPNKNALQELTHDYMRDLYAYGVAFSKISIYVFNQLPINEQQKTIDYAKHHLDILALVAREYKHLGNVDVPDTLSYDMHDIKRTVTQLDIQLENNKAIQKKATTNKVPKKPDDISHEDWHML